MKRVLLIAGLVVGLGTGAGAGTISMSTDKTTYQVGETIVLTIAADAEGDNVNQNISVQVRYDTARMTALGQMGPVAGHDGQRPDLFTQAYGTLFETIPNRLGDEGSCGVVQPDVCVAFLQVFFNDNPVDAMNPDTGSRDVELAVFHFIAAATGTASFSFRDEGGGHFNFPGIATGSDVGTAPAGFSVQIVPEPSVLSLIALGLAGLALGSRLRA